MAVQPAALYRTPNALAPHYSRFRVAERLLLSGHSHQAWPDCGFEGQCEAWAEAAELVDDKWEAAFGKSERVARGYSSLLGEDPVTGGHLALAANTHDLVVKFLSGLPLRRRPRIVTTGGEYHSLRRQLDRLVEEGIEIVKVAAHPAATVAGRLAAAVDDRTAAVMVSHVFYQSAQIAPGLGEAARACERAGAAFLVDAYHTLNVVPFSVHEEGLDNAFLVGGGYKYCQLGEGCGWMRFPRDCEMRPIVTGWFSEFGTISASKRNQPFVYGEGPYIFAGATYDPASHYRAAAVFDFFETHGLTPALLREVSQHQVGLLAERFDALDADPRLVTRDRSVPLAGIAGFLALRSARAGEIYNGLRTRGVWCDYRDQVLRLGPAPYLADAQIEEAVAILGEVVHGDARRTAAVAR